MNIAVLLAGGHGARMGSDLPKQFLPLRGKTIIEHTIEAFSLNQNIDEIAIVMHRDYIARMQQIVDANGYSKVKKILSGGDERYLSTLAALEAYLDYPDDTHLIFHDAVRPLVSQRIINDVVADLEHHRAVGVAIPSTDTIWQINPLDNVVLTAPERSHLRRAQTPQAFHLVVIRDAYQRALQDVQFRCTDDCGVVLRYMKEVRVHIVEGENRNLKITLPEDLVIAEQLLNL